jgi:hypothetical protein
LPEATLTLPAMFLAVPSVLSRVLDFILGAPLLGMTGVDEAGI